MELSRKFDFENFQVVVWRCAVCDDLGMGSEWKYSVLTVILCLVWRQEIELD